MPDLCDWRKMCEIVAGAEPRCEPGTRIGRHAVTFGHVVGEIVRRATGKPISEIVRDAVSTPLGVADERCFAVPQDEQGRLARLEEAAGDGDSAAGVVRRADG